MNFKKFEDDEFGAGKYLVGFMVLGFFVMMVL